MLQNPATSLFQLITTLSRIRLESQDTADGNSLLKVEGNMGMLLVDLSNGISLATSEQVQVFGKDLFQELQDYSYEQTRSDLRPCVHRHATWQFFHSLPDC